MRSIRRGVLALAACVALVGTTACEDATAADASAQPVALTFVAGTQAAVAAGDPITVGSNTLVLTDVDVTFAEVVLEREEGELGDGDSDGDMDGDSDSESDSDSDGFANERFRSGPITVALPLEGGMITPITEAIPFGVYEELELDVATLRLRGTWNGEPFDLLLPVDEEIEAELSPAFVVDEDTDQLNLTIAFDVQDWFLFNGALVDPALLATPGPAREAFIERIESAFKAFEDSDRDADDADSDSDSH